MEQLKILFVTQEDPFYVKNFFEEFFDIYPFFKKEIKGIVVCRTLGQGSIMKLIRKLYAFYGFKDFIKMIVRYFNLKLSAIGRKFGLTKKNFTLEQLFSAHGLNYEYVSDVNNKNFIDKWKGQGINLIVSVAASEIFKQPLLDMPELGCINIHHAPLPRYRGMLPNFWQMFNDEKEVFITVHKMDTKLDNGDMISQRSVLINNDESLDQLIKRTKRLGAHVMKESLDKIREGRVSCIPVDSAEQGSYYSFPQAEDVKEFRKKGYRLL